MVSQDIWSANSTFFSDDHNYLISPDDHQVNDIEKGVHLEDQEKEAPFRKYSLRQVEFNTYNLCVTMSYLNHQPINVCFYYWKSAQQSFLMKIVNLSLKQNLILEDGMGKRWSFY